MRIENGYLQQSMLCSKNNRNAVGNFSDTMNKAQECISNKISTRDSYETVQIIVTLEFIQKIAYLKMLNYQ